MNYDSADVWTNPGLFELRDDLSPIRVSGVPPDYFSKTGQRWGNPLYRWDVLGAAGVSIGGSIASAGRNRFTTLFASTISADLRRSGRFRRNTRRQSTANGSRLRGKSCFSAFATSWENCPLSRRIWASSPRMLIALREQFDFPGMRILQFGFADRSAHNYLPHQYVPNTVVYTGTHDNNTTRGWWEHEATKFEKEAVKAYLCPPKKDVVWTMISRPGSVGGRRLHRAGAGCAGSRQRRRG